MEYTTISQQHALTPIDISSSPFISTHLTNTIIPQYIKRQLLLYSKNISSLDNITNDKDIFLLYELIPTEQPALTVADIVQLSLIKSMLLNLQTHLIIQIADEEAYATNKFNLNQITKLSNDKLSNILTFIIPNEQNENVSQRVHVFFNRQFRLVNNEYETVVSQYKMKVPYDKVKTLFNLSEDDNVTKLDYPCYIANAVNGAFYTQYVPEITKETTCVIVNQVNKAHRYELCYDAAEKMKFNAPVLLLYRTVPCLTGAQGQECYLDNDRTLLSVDDDKALRKKIMKYSLSGSRGNGSTEDHKKYGGDVEMDISCQYLKFLEMDDTVLNGNVERFGKGELLCGEIKQVLYEKLVKIFGEVKAGHIKDVERFYLIKSE